ncbi:MAG: N-6 DNA methylase [Deltaproteobacteria bacterium]|nr:N-6 DNA methylase [Deltaproteobacteria bacterium]
MPPEKQYWQIDTDRLASELGRAARRSHTEEDFKMAAEPLIRRSFESLGVDVEVVRYEKATTGFRSTKNLADVVYGYLVIEYKAPGKLRRSSSLRESKEQLERYLSGEAEKYGAHKEDALEKMVGVSLDGEQILFCRFSRTARLLMPAVPVRRAEQMGLFPHERPSRGFQFLGPYPVSASSLANLLIYARAAGRRPLTAEDLARVFGPNSSVAQQAISELYSAVMRGQRRTGPDRVKTFFQEWDRLFGVVYGEELEKAERTAEETARLYHMPGGVRLKQFLFAIHTYYAFLMKLIAVELLAMQRESTVEAFVAELSGLDSNRLRERLTYLESGYAFSAHGIENFLEADLFSWYLDSWTSALAEAVREMVRALAEFEPATPVLEPQWTQDLLQKLYELIVPQKLRHDLGEYYTPGWLAGYLIEKTGYTGSPDSRFLDPACGSGTFLVHAIHRAIQHAEARPRMRTAQAARAILDNIVGFDLNPLAVLAARTNYLIAFSRFIPYVRPISMPVYLCDSVVPPDKSKDPQQSLYDNDVVVFTTTVKDYVLPLSMKDKAKIDQFTGLVDTAIRGKLEPGSFARQVSKEMSLPAGDRERLVEVYRVIKELADQK